MKKLEMNQMENLQGGGGTEDWCNAISGLGGAEYIASLDDVMESYVGGLYAMYCAY